MESGIFEQEELDSAFRLSWRALVFKLEYDQPLQPLVEKSFQ
jgi:hypothetical protein